MFAGTKLHDLPGRLVTGAYILHEGLGKWDTDEDRAAALHGRACGAFPLFNKMQPRQFTTLLSTAEITTGALLLAPFVPTALAGLALSGFAGGLVAMYLRTPEMRQDGSIWPSRQGMAVSKDSWMLAMGIGFVLDGVGREGRQRRKIARAARKLVKEQRGS